jgi:hypothetical protein
MAPETVLLLALYLPFSNLLYEFLSNYSPPNPLKGERGSEEV